MNLKASYSLPHGCTIFLTVKPTSMLRHTISIEMQKEDKRLTILKDCIYEDDHVEFKTYMSDLMNVFNLTFVEFHNTVTAEFTFDLLKGIVYVKHAQNLLMCPNNQTLRV